MEDHVTSKYAVFSLRPELFPDSGKQKLLDIKKRNDNVWIVMNSS